LGQRLDEGHHQRAVLLEGAYQRYPGGLEPLHRGGAGVGEHDPGDLRDVLVEALLHRAVEQRLLGPEVVTDGGEIGA
jgi:hypothetical protein